MPMVDAALTLPLDAEGFLAWEALQGCKYEYVRGEVFAMVGARRKHVIAALNMAAALKARLRGGPCQVYISDMKLRVAAADAFYYPDVMVSCDARDREADTHLEHARLVVEVLSLSTEAYDRGDKFASYRLLESLQEYVLVDLTAFRIETYRRTPEGDWLLHDWRPDQGPCHLHSLGLELPFDEVFEDLMPPDRSATTRS